MEYFFATPKCFTLSNLSIDYTWKDIKMSNKNNKFKVSATTWNDEFKWLDGPYSVWLDG